MKRVAVIQSNYIPWKGYFDIIHDADLFIFYDDIQFTKNDWRNRNKIKVPDGTLWLSVPVGQSLNRLINEVKIQNSNWNKKHYKTLEQYYGGAQYFKLYKDFFKHAYFEKKWEYLWELNHFLIKHISSDFLGLKTNFDVSWNYELSGQRLERLLDLLVKAGATEYITGPAAKEYIDEKLFAEKGIKLTWKDYSAYPDYKQFHPPFIHGVSILDLLFHTGNDAQHYIWGWREDKK